jgi:rhamnosyltransferase
MGVVWLDDLLDSLLSHIENVIDEFINNDNLGIVIPEAPYIFRKLLLPGFSISLNKLLNDLWNRLKCHKILDFKDMKNIILPIGNMFWYRPSALKPLFELQLPPSEIPQEPLGKETIFHAIEHILVYIAWNEGYDYRISPSFKIKESNFINMYRVYNTKNYLMGSRAYRIGRMVLAPPRIIKRFLAYIIPLIIKRQRPANPLN